MAIVKGALFSMDASGKFASSMVFTKWKNRQVCRQLVTPGNPRTQNQVDTRNAMRVAAKGQNWANMTVTKGNSRTKTDKDLIKAATPSGFAWNGYLVEQIVGKGMLNYDAAVTAYTALSSGNKTAWNSAAAALTPAIPACAQGAAGGGADTPIAAGQVWFTYQYALSLLGIADTPGATPPTYA